MIRSGLTHPHPTTNPPITPNNLSENENVLNIKNNADIQPPHSRARYPARMSLFPGTVEDTDVLFHHGYSDAKQFFENNYGLQEVKKQVGEGEGGGGWGWGWGKG